MQAASAVRLCDLLQIACLLFPLVASGQELIMNLLDLEPKERREAVEKFLDLKATAAPLS